MKYFMACMRRYADFSGRSRRAEYWWFALITGLFISLPMIIGTILMISGSGSQTITDDGSVVTTGGNPGMTTAGDAITAIFGLLSLAFIIPSLAVTVRRLHDTNHSGWWLFISLIPIVGPIVLLVFYLTDSTPGPNQWGPNPKGIGNDAGPYGEMGGYGQAGGYGSMTGYGQAGDHQQGTYGQAGPYTQQ